MTPSQTIEAALKREIEEGAQRHVTPKDFVAWMRGAGFSPSAVSAATGADKKAVRDKVKAADRPGTPPEEIARLSQPLNGRTFRGQAEDWQIGRPQNEIIRRLSQVLDAIGDQEIIEAYVNILGRLPDMPGYTFWLLKRQAGLSIEDIRKHMRASKEAQHD